MSNHVFDVEKWQAMSLFAQMGNIGAEVGRTFNAEERGDTVSARAAFYRGLDLIDATMEQMSREQTPRLREVARAREQFATAAETGIIDRGLENYFMQFAIAERLQRPTYPPA